MIFFLNYIQGIRQEIKFELDKVGASQRLEFSLEKGRIREDFNTMQDKLTDISNKLDREIASRQ
jgi:phage protein U